MILVAMYNYQELAHNQTTFHEHADRKLPEDVNWSRLRLTADLVVNQCFASISVPV
jgi:hypothetical protein